MLHGPPSPNAAAVEVMMDLRDRGWLTRIGVGTENDRSARDWAGVGGIDVIELGVRAGDPTAIAQVSAAGVARWARGVVRGGHKADPPEVAEAVARLAADAGVEPIDLDLSWIITRASPEVVLIGASSEAHVVDLAQRVAGSRIEPDVLDQLEALRHV